MESLKRKEQPDKGLKMKAFMEKIGWVRPVLAVMVLIWLGVYFWLVGANLYAANLVEKEQSFEALETAVEMDHFEFADYLLTYVMATVNQAEEFPPEIKNKAAEYADRLMKINSNVIPYHLCVYYFYNGKTEKGFEAALKYLNYMKSSPEAWQNTLAVIQNADDGSSAFRSGMQKVIAAYDRYHETSMEELELDENARKYLNSMRK